MPELGNYAAEIYAAYAISLGLIVGLVVVVVLNARNARRVLAELEARKDG